jgi:hypothetical protein
MVFRAAPQMESDPGRFDAIVSMRDNNGHHDPDFIKSRSPLSLIIAVATKRRTHA